MPILVLASCACDEGTLLRLPYTTATISGTGILQGAGAKFSPLACTPSAVDTGLDDRFTNHLSLAPHGCAPSKMQFSKASNYLFCHLLNFSVFSCWVLACSSSNASTWGTHVERKLSPLEEQIKVKLTCRPVICGPSGYVCWSI